MAPNATPADREFVRFGHEEVNDFSVLDEFFEQPYAPSACRVIHMGCGRGHVAVYLAQRGLRVMGIDTDREQLAAARERSRMADVDIDLMAGDPLELPPIPEESIGLNVDFNTAVDLKDGLEREEFLRIVIRYLARGGIILSAGPVAVNEESDDPENSFAFGSPFVSDFTRAGFAVLMQGIRTVPNGESRLVVHAQKPL
jgi:SAM-dependent methyltransferase